MSAPHTGPLAGCDRLRQRGAEGVVADLPAEETGRAYPGHATPDQSRGKLLRRCCKARPAKARANAPPHLDVHVAVQHFAAQGRRRVGVLTGDCGEGRQGRRHTTGDHSGPRQG